MTLPSPDSSLSRILSECPLPLDWPTVVSFAEQHGHAALVARARAVNELRGDLAPIGRAEDASFLRWVKEAPTAEIAMQLSYACGWNRVAIRRELSRRT
jgi:hypothetical protein